MTTFTLRKFAVSSALILSLFVGSAVLADVGGDNPTGTSGQFNGNVTTGCSYDAYTANATRSVTDLVVAGGVGSYPLAFTRTMNSRYTVGTANAPAFGQSGTWTHSYQWSIDSTTVTNTGSAGLPASYNVNYPDGRRVAFKNFGTLPSGTTDPDFRGPLGIRDRFIQLSSGATECYVRLPDGGKVWFHANISTTVSGSTYTSVYTFALKGIIDPYGQTTTVASSGGTTTITEPAGRTIQILTRTITSTSQGALNDVVVDHVTGSDGRTVQYNYTAYITANGTRYISLSSVVYFGDSTLNASYTYQAGNVDPNGRPLLRAAVDPMYDGPMWKIAYVFVPNATGVVYGELKSENYFDGTNVGAAVSTLAVTGTSTRTETRGDNPTGGGNPVRTFTYNGYKLATATDFKNVASSQNYNGNYYLNSVTDRKNNTTTFTPNQLNGEVTAASYPGMSTLNYDFGGNNCADPNNQDQYNKYWLFQGADGSQYYRDTNHQVTSIDLNMYDGIGRLAYTYKEGFSYNNFGQVLTHYLRNDGNSPWASENWQYDTGNTGKVTAYWDAAHPTSGNPTAWYQYDSYGRVSGMTEARGSSSGDPNYTTSFQYNARGQLTRLTHPDSTYIQYSYNPNGTLAWTADERHTGAASDATQRTSYTYDDYKRLRTVTTPLRASADSTPRVTTYYYDQNGTGEDYTRIAAVPTKVVSPGSKIVTTAYDQNLRALSVTAVGDSNVPSATTSYTYDPNGNVLTVKDPNGQTSGAVTTYAYDGMNRVLSVTDPLSADRNSNGHTMDYGYDSSGNLSSQTRADGQSCSYLYWSTGWLYRQTGYAGEVTKYDYYPNGEIGDYYYQKADGTWITYSYYRDSLGRLTSTTYPADVSGIQQSESYHYDIANHIDQYTNPKTQVKTLVYDNRGRLKDTTWSNHDPSVHIDYDATRPTDIITKDGNSGASITTIAFGYDEANNRIYEDQTISGLPTRRVQTDPDADGNRTDLLVKTGGTVNTALYFDYTSRNELLNIYDSGHAGFFKYSYDSSGNITQRVGQRLHDSTVTQYDAINRAIVSSQNGLNGANFATSHYDYDSLGNLRDTYRDEEGGKGERFGYDPSTQLTSAVYSASAVTTTSPQNPAKTVSYSLSNRNLKTMTVTDNTVSPAVTTTTNCTNVDLNEISSIQINSNPAQSLSWDNSMNMTGYNGWGYSYDAENRLTSVGGAHSAQFLYDGVGRCVRRTIDGAATVFTYDQWTPVAEWDGSGNWLATNVYGLGDDELVYRLTGPWQYFVKSDPMGNVKFLLDASGNGIEKYKYDAFGAPTITDWSGNVRGTSACGNRFMFSGRDYMSSLGLYDMRNRVYDPVMGRFYQLDPIGFEGDPLNLYRFGGNNPLLGGDPMGLDDEDPIMTFYASWGGSGVSGSSDAAVSASGSWWGDPISDSSTALSSYSDISSDYYIAANSGPIADRSQGLATYNGPRPSFPNFFPKSIADLKSQITAGLWASVPGKLYWDNATNSFKSGNYIAATGWSVATFADQIFFAVTAGEGTVAKQAIEEGVSQGSAREIQQDATFLYQKVGPSGEHLKFGITKNPLTRYSESELGGGSMRILAEGRRQEMLQLERNLHLTLPIGPEERQLFYIQKQINNGLRPPPYSLTAP